VKIVTTDQMIKMERQCEARGIATSMLMENAGMAIARHIVRLMGSPAGRHILMLVGPGNNGGDGLVAARHLHDWGALVDVYLPRARKGDDPNLDVVVARGIPVTLASDDKDYVRLEGILGTCDTVVDSIFGTGKLRSLEGIFKDILLKVRSARESRPDIRIIAVDLPSGVDSDSGDADPACLSADLTITLGYPKVGLFSFPGSAFAGELVVADIGIPADMGDSIDVELMTRGMVRALLPARPVNANKGTFGRVLVCAGSLNYIGAAYLACEGAMRVGAGLVTLAVARSLQPVLASKLTEVTYAPLPEATPGYVGGGAARAVHERLADCDVLLMGCGLSQHPEVLTFISSTLLDMPPSLSPKIVLDADALNALSHTPQWWRLFDKHVILTPHPGEMARLSKTSVEKINQDRLSVSRQAARRWNKTIVLKGAHTVVSSPEGGERVSGMANPGLASAGTGDVLAGAIAGLLAQGMNHFNAATCGVYLHALAGGIVRRELGDAGMVASDLLPALPVAIKRTKDG